MGAAWMKDMSHSDFPDEKAHEFPGQAHGAHVATTMTISAIQYTRIATHKRNRIEESPCI